MTTELIINQIEQQYTKILGQAINEIKTARTTLARQVNSTVMSAHWNIGKLLFEEKLDGKYGSGIVERLSVDLKTEFPDMGVSPRNLWDMKRFYAAYYQAETKLRHAVAVLPWGHNLLLLNKVKSLQEVEYYAKESMQKSWTRDLLLNAIKMDMYAKEKPQIANNNFQLTLPKIQAEYANEVFKCSYNLGFIGASELLKERDLEKRLVEKIKQFILELGKGFSFVGNQYRLEYMGAEYFVDMLFYHRKLMALVAIELKIGDFKPEYIGKMNYYLSILDKIEKNENENPSIGIILCASNDHVDVELALQDFNKPIAIALYELFPKQELQAFLAETFHQLSNREKTENE